MAARRRVTPSSGNRPLAVLRGRMRSLQREAAALLEQAGGEAASSKSRTRAADPEERKGKQPDLTEREGPAERFRFGLERELTRRLKSVLERLDLPSRQELDALDKRLLKLEKRMEEELSSKQVAKSKVRRHRAKIR